MLLKLFDTACQNLFHQAVDDLDARKVALVHRPVGGLPRKRLLVQRPVRVAVKETPHLVFQLADPLHGIRFEKGDRRGLQVVIPQDLFGDLVGHVGQQLLAQPDARGRDLDQLVIIDPLDRTVEGHPARRRQPREQHRTGRTRRRSSARRIAALKEGFKRNGVYPFHIMYDTGVAEEIKDAVGELGYPHK